MAPSRLDLQGLFPVDVRVLAGDVHTDFAGKSGELSLREVELCVTLDVLVARGVFDCVRVASELLPRPEVGDA